jgi:hypothetical protein
MSQENEASLRELAERLLTEHRGRLRDPRNPEPPMLELLPGQVPGDLPVRLPDLPGARLIGSMVARDAQGLVGWEVLMDVPGDLPTLDQVYVQSLAEQGWLEIKDAPSGMFPEGGFQMDLHRPPPAEMLARMAERQAAMPPERQAQIARYEAHRPQQRRFSAPPASGEIRLTLRPRPGSPIEARLYGDIAGWGSQMMHEQLQTGIVRRLPILSPPPGVFLMPNGGGGNANNWTSKATAMTDQAPAILETHFAAQLAAAGWTRKAGDVTESFAWSLWAIPDAPGAQGFLSVLEAPDPLRRNLMVQIEAADGESGGGGGFLFGLGSSIH